MLPFGAQRIVEILTQLPVAAAIELDPRTPQTFPVLLGQSLTDTPRGRRPNQKLPQVRFEQRNITAMTAQHLSQPQTSFVRRSRGDQPVLLGLETGDQMHQHRHRLSRPHSPPRSGALHLYRHQRAASGVGQIEIDRIHMLERHRVPRPLDTAPSCFAVPHTGQQRFHRAQILVLESASSNPPTVERHANPLR